MDPRDHENGWERFRGEVMAELRGLRECNEDLRVDFRSHVEECRQEISNVHSRVTRVWIAIAVAMASLALGGMTGTIAWLMNRTP